MTTKDPPCNHVRHIFDAEGRCWYCVQETKSPCPCGIDGCRCEEQQDEDADVDERSNPRWER